MTHAGRTENQRIPRDGGGPDNGMTWMRNETCDTCDVGMIHVITDVAFGLCAFIIVCIDRFMLDVS